VLKVNERPGNDFQ